MKLNRAAIQEIGNVSTLRSGAWSLKASSTRTRLASNVERPTHCRRTCDRALSSWKINNQAFHFITDTANQSSRLQTGRKWHIKATSAADAAAELQGTTNKPQGEVLAPTVTHNPWHSLKNGMNKFLLDFGRRLKCVESANWCQQEPNEPIWEQVGDAWERVTSLPEVKTALQIGQFAASLLFVVLYVWATYKAPQPFSWRFNLDLLLCAVFAVDYLLRFLVGAEAQDLELYLHLSTLHVPHHLWIAADHKVHRVRARDMRVSCRWLSAREESLWNFPCKSLCTGCWKIEIPSTSLGGKGKSSWRPWGSSPLCSQSTFESVLWGLWLSAREVLTVAWMVNRRQSPSFAWCWDSGMS